MVPFDGVRDVHFFLRAGWDFDRLGETDKFSMFFNRHRRPGGEFTFLRFRSMAHGMPAVMMRWVPLELVPVADKTKAHNIRTDFGGRDQSTVSL